jgi:hypothetical protein
VGERQHRKNFAGRHTLHRLVSKGGGQRCFALQFISFQKDLAADFTIELIHHQQTRILNLDLLRHNHAQYINSQRQATLNEEAVDY